MELISVDDKRFSTYIPPNKFVSPLSGEQFIVPWWIPLDKDNPEQHLELARQFYEENKNKKWQKNEVPQTTQKWLVKNYEVTNVNGKWACTCVGFQFRRDCKHIHHIRDNKPLEEKKPSKKKKA
jgi:hypothetical protein